MESRVFFLLTHELTIHQLKGAALRWAWFITLFQMHGPGSLFGQVLFPLWGPGKFQVRTSCPLLQFQEVSTRRQHFPSLHSGYCFSQGLSPVLGGS